MNIDSFLVNPQPENLIGTFLILVFLVIFASLFNRVTRHKKPKLTTALVLVSGGIGFWLGQVV